MILNFALPDVGAELSSCNVTAFKLVAKFANKTVVSDPDPRLSVSSMTGVAVSEGSICKWREPLLSDV